MLLGTYEVAGGWRHIDEYLPADREGHAGAGAGGRHEKYLYGASTASGGVLVPLPTDDSAPLDSMPAGPRS